MGYLEDFQKPLDKNDLRKFFQLWEEYCASDAIDLQEWLDILKAIKKSELVKSIGPYIEAALPLWETVKDQEKAYQIFALLVDLQTTNSPKLTQMVYSELEKRYGQTPDFAKRLRLVGFRQGESVAGVITAYELLEKLVEKHFVYHAGGWGAGEVIKTSPIREEVTIDFENLSVPKTISFQNAFKTLVPLPAEHFLVQRFATPDALEAFARESPVEMMRLLLNDLGPKHAAEIKDLLCGVIIQESDWAKWWQGVRAKLKKETFFQVPDQLREPFRLRSVELTHEERLYNEVNQKTGLSEIIMIMYNYVRDFPEILKKKQVKHALQEKIVGLLSSPDIPEAQRLQGNIFLEEYFQEAKVSPSVQELIKNSSTLTQSIQAIDILAFKKRALMAVRAYRADWVPLFLELLLLLPQNALRDYLFKELQAQESAPQLLKTLESLIAHPEKHPDLFMWYFQKVADGKNVPLNQREERYRLFEHFLILFCYLESQNDQKELVKKMYQILSTRRFLLVRQMIEGASEQFLREFLLLASKCTTLSEHDKKIMRSLAEVVQPTLAHKKTKSHDHRTFWATESSFLRAQERLQHLGSVEMVQVAAEIGAARAHGDLRENAEYKCALEKRAGLQNEMRMLADQIRNARVITRQDVVPGVVGVGTKVILQSESGLKTLYTILGPWDADAENNILSTQSKLAESMLDKHVNETFQFRDEQFTIVSIESIFS